MADHNETQEELIAACSIDALTANGLATVLGRQPQPTKQMADRLERVGDLDLVPHPRRPGAVQFRASQQGLARLAGASVMLKPGSYLVLIGDGVAATARLSLASFVRTHKPIWICRLHGRYRLAVAYSDSVVADALEALLAGESDDPGGVVVVRTDGRRFATQL